MKRFFMLAALLCAAVMLLLATPGTDHKILWCHFPPGQDGAKVLILSIDVAADGSIGPAHLNHPGDGPFDSGSQTCGTCGFAAVGHLENGVEVFGPANIPLLGTPPNCTCPAGTPVGDSGNTAVVIDPASPSGKSCGLTI
jgi:hypothetical protein